MDMLGKKIKCKITGTVGIAVQRIEYLNGCIQYLLQPKKLKDGLPVGTIWFDEEQLELVSAKKVVKPKEKRTGGPGPKTTPHMGK